MEFIRVRGARTHNLKNINLDIPRNQLVVVTGLTLWFFNLLRDTRSRIDMALHGAAVSD